VAELTRAHLVTEHQPGRYALHDLLRAYAAEQARLSDSETDRREATGRVLDHYMHTASTAAFLLHPSLFTRTRPQPGISPEHITDHQDALGWLEAEHEVLISAVELAARTGFDTCAWQLAWAIADFLFRRGRWHECAAIQRIALAAATRDGSLVGQAAARRNIAMTCIRLAGYAEASSQLTACLELNRQMGDRRGEARTYQALGDVSAYQGRDADALSHAERALALFQAIADQAGEAGVLNDLGCCHAALGNYQRAQSLSQQALALSRELGNRPLEAIAWDSVGHAKHLSGHPSEAVACYQAALDLYREFGDRFYEANTLTRLGDSREAAGDSREARESWQRALEIFDSLNHPSADQVRAKLDQDGPAPRA
jgi:tetratricopeptide (TPR) repeat protein